MNSDVFRASREMIQAGANRILTMFTAGNDRPDFFEIFIANDCFDLIKSIFATDNNDLADRAGPLKCADGMCDDRAANNRCEQLVETHAATATGCDDDGSQHGQNQKRPTPNVQRPTPNSEGSHSA